MFVFVWIVFLVLQKSLCFQPERLINSTEQYSSVSSMNEVTGTGKLSDISVTANLESTQETGVGKSDSNPECNDGDCSSLLDSSSAQSAVSPKVTWSSAESLGVTPRNAGSLTTILTSTSGISETNVMNHPTTDIYGTLNHNDNELDSEVNDKGTPIAINHTVKTTENLPVNVTHFSVEDSEETLLTKIPSKRLEVTHKPITFSDNSSEHLLEISSSDDIHLKSTTSRYVETSSFVGTVLLSDVTGTKVDATLNSNPLLRFTRNTISNNGTETTTITTHSGLHAELVSLAQESELPFTTANPLGTTVPEEAISSRKGPTLLHFLTIQPDTLKLNFTAELNTETVPLVEESKSTFSTAIPLGGTVSEEKTSGRESALLRLVTIHPNSPKLNLNANNSFENVTSVKNSSLSDFINSANLSFTDQSVLAKGADSVDIQETETKSSGTMLSTTTAQSLKEIHSTVQSETLPPDISQRGHEMPTSTLASENMDIIGDLLVNETSFKSFKHLAHNASTLSPFLEPISAENHRTVEEILNLTDITSTISYYTVDNSQVSDIKDRTMDNNLFQFPEISLSKETAVSFEETSSIYPTSPDTLEKKMFPSTTESGSSLNISVEHAKIQSMVHPSAVGEQGITASSILTTGETDFAMTPIVENTNSESHRSVDLTSLSLNDSSKSLSSIISSQSTTINPPTLHSTVDQTTISSHVLDQTSLHAIDLVLTTLVHHSTPSSTIDQVTLSSSVDQSTSLSSVDQTSSSVDQTSSNFVGHTYSSSIDQTPINAVDQKSSSTIQQPTSPSSVVSTITVFKSRPVTEIKVVTTDVDDATTLIPLSQSSTPIPQTSASIHVFPSMLLTSTGYTIPNKEMTSVIPKLESIDVTNPPETTPFFNYTPIQTSTATETHREGKHIPFSTESSRRETVEHSNEVIFVTPTKGTEMETTTLNLNEVIYNQMHFEDLTANERSNVMTAVVQLSPQDLDIMDINVKIAEVHTWLAHVLMKEFQNWTKDPFDEIGSQSGDIPFGKVTIFYLLPTPKTKSSNITMTFIVHNQWKNETLPVDFVLSILKFYSADLKQSMNASAVHFYHGLLMEESDLLPAMLEKYGVLVFTSALAVIGCTLLICIVIIYRKRNRRSVHYLANSKLQQNLQESVGIDLTPAVVILQDEKKILNGNSKICDDEGWLVPIHEVPLAEDCNMPKVQDTKL